METILKLLGQLKDPMAIVFIIVVLLPLFFIVRTVRKKYAMTSAPPLPPHPPAPGPAPAPHPPTPAPHGPGTHPVAHARRVQRRMQRIRKGFIVLVWLVIILVLATIGFGVWWSSSFASPATLFGPFAGTLGVIAVASTLLIPLFYLIVVDWKKAKTMFWSTLLTILMLGIIGVALLPNILAGPMEIPAMHWTQAVRRIPGGPGVAFGLIALVALIASLCLQRVTKALKLCCYVFGLYVCLRAVAELKWNRAITIADRADNKSYYAKEIHELLRRNHRGVRLWTGHFKEIVNNDPAWNSFQAAPVAWDFSTQVFTLDIPLEYRENLNIDTRVHPGETIARGTWTWTNEHGKVLRSGNVELSTSVPDPTDGSEVGGVIYNLPHGRWNDTITLNLRFVFKPQSTLHAFHEVVQDAIKTNIIK